MPTAGSRCCGAWRPARCACWRAIWSAPSPLALEALNARPYAFLDDAPLEERRTQAVQNRRYTDPQSADDVGQLDAQAIASVREEAWPQPRSVDEMHEALGMLGALNDDEVARQADWKKWLTALAKAGRATRLLLEGKGRTARGLWVTAERLGLLRTVAPDAPMQPAIAAPDDAEQPADRDTALRELLRSRLGGLGPVTVAQLATPLFLSTADVEGALLALQTEGSVLQAASRPAAPSPNGASAICWHASTATRSDACAARSNRSSRATSCASSSNGSTSARARA